MSIVTEYDWERDTMTHHTPRAAFRATVAEVAARAKDKLPTAVNGRVESAVRLVLAHDVTRLDDGTIEVGSSSDPLKTYRLVGATCECQDFTRGQAPDGWCQHRIAAGIAKRVQEVLPQSPPMEPAPTPAPAVPPALPEAPASCNVYVTIGGHKVQVTLRDSDEHRMLARLQTLLAQYPAPEAPAQGQLSPQQHNAAAMHRPVTGFCPVHQVQMKLNQKNGRSWHSHRLDDGSWCKGK